MGRIMKLAFQLVCTSTRTLKTFIILNTPSSRYVMETCFQYSGLSNDWQWFY